MNKFFVQGAEVKDNTLARASDINGPLKGVEAGFDKLPDPDRLAQSRVTHGVDSGRANSYLIALPVPVVEYVAGFELSFVPAASNDGPCAVNVDGVGVKAIKGYDGLDLVTGNVRAGIVVSLRYNGNVFILSSAYAGHGDATGEGAQVAQDAAARAAASAAAAETSEESATASSEASTVSATAATAAASDADADRVSTAADVARIEEYLNEFDDLYLGSKTDDPGLDNDGNTLLDGALYFNTVTANVRAYDSSSSTWIVISDGDLSSLNNLSDVGDASTSRTNLGLEIGVDVQAYAAVLDGTTAEFTIEKDDKLSLLNISSNTDPAEISWMKRSLGADLLTGTNELRAKLNLSTLVTDNSNDLITYDASTMAFTVVEAGTYMFGSHGHLTASGDMVKNELAVYKGETLLFSETYVQDALGGITYTYNLRPAEPFTLAAGDMISFRAILNVNGAGPGSSFLAENSHCWILRLPEGATGAAGPAGEAGPEGATGATGPAGADGVLTAQQETDLAADTGARHGHTNKATLDEIGHTGTVLTYRGAPITSSGGGNPKAYVSITDVEGVVTLVQDDGTISVITLPTAGGQTTALTADALVALIDGLNDAAVAAIKIDLEIPAAESDDVLIAAVLVGSDLTFTHRNSSTETFTFPPGLTPEQAQQLEINSGKRTYPETDQDKLATIARDANVNVKSSWLATGGDAEILDKPVIPPAITAGAVKTLAESLTGTGRIDASAIKNLPTPSGLSSTALSSMKRRLAANATINQNVTAILDFSVQVDDFSQTDIAYSAITNLFTIQETGLYTFGAHLECTATGADTTVSYRFLNGTVRVHAGSASYKGNSGSLIMQGSNEPFSMASGDTLTLEITPTNSNQTITATTSHMWVTRMNGPTGQAGQDGSDGAAGQDGAAGTTGAPGADGLVGSDGATGGRGLQGAPGTPGSAGATGGVGPRGQPGATGADGTAGSDGATGGEGQPGNRGQDGATGATGADGAAGTPGPQGQPGSAGAVGGRGPDGTDGTDGSDGAQGEPGSDGPQGNPGADGARGQTGAAGAPGADGSQGPQGNAGTDGTDGEAGRAGTQGIQGERGVAGPQGSSGALTTQEATNLAANTGARHSHTNKGTLDNIGQTSDGKLAFNGNTVDTVEAQRDVLNALTGINPNVSLAAPQGKVLDDKITAEAAARVTADNAESTARATGDGHLQTNITTEETDRTAADIALGLRIDETTVEHPLIVKRDMPSLEDTADLAAASFGGNSALWLLANNQNGSSNRADSMVRALIPGLTDADGLAIPTSAVVGDTLRLRAGTLVRVVSGNDFRVIQASVSAREDTFVGATSVNGVMTLTRADGTTEVLNVGSGASGSVVPGDETIIYSIKGQNLEARSLVTGNAIPSLTVVLGAGNWRGLASWGKHILILDDSTSKVHFRNAVTLEDEPSLTLSLGGSGRKGIFVVENDLYLCAATSVNVWDLVTRLHVPARELSLLSGFTGSPVSGFSEDGTVRILTDQGRVYGFSRTGGRVTSRDQNISSFSTFATTNPWRGAAHAADIDYYLDSVANVWRAFFKNTTNRSETHDVVLGSGTFYDGVATSHHTEIDLFAGLVSSTPVADDKFPYRKVTAATTGKFDITFGPRVNNNISGYGRATNAIVGGHSRELYHSTGSLSESVPPLRAFYLGSTRFIDVILDKAFVGAATGNFDLTFNFDNGNANTHIMVFTSNSAIVGDFVYFKSLTALPSGDASFFANGKVLSNVNIVLSDGRSISPVLPESESTEVVPYSELDGRWLTDKVTISAAMKNQINTPMLTEVTDLQVYINPGAGFNTWFNYGPDTANAPSTGAGMLIGFRKANSAGNSVVIGVDALGFHYRNNEDAWVNLVNVAGGGGGSSDTGAQILAKLFPVDGAGSGLDSDTVDGITGRDIVHRNIVNLTNILDRPTILTTNLFSQYQAGAYAPTPALGGYTLSLGPSVNSNVAMVDLAWDANGAYYRLGKAQNAFSGVAVPWIKVGGDNNFSDDYKNKLDNLGNGFVLPEDLQLIANNSKVERGQETTVIRLVNEPTNIDNGLLDKVFWRAHNFNYKPGYSDAGAITLENNLLLGIVSNSTDTRIAVSEQIRKLEINGINQPLTYRVVSFGPFWLKEAHPAYTYSFNPASAYAANTPLTIKITKKDGDIVHWGALKRVVMNKEIEVTSLYSPELTNLDDLTQPRETHVNAYEAGADGSPDPAAYGYVATYGGHPGAGSFRIIADNLHNNLYAQFSVGSGLASPITNNFNHRIKTEADNFNSERRNIILVEKQTEGHGLGVVPSNYWLIATPIQDNDEFVIGDTIKINTDWRTGTEGINVWADHENVYYQTGAYGYRLSGSTTLQNPQPNDAASVVAQKIRELAQWNFTFHAIK